LKLDKSFVDDVGGGDVNGALAETIVQLGRTLHLQTIAEGIENSSQIDALRAFGCTFGQGFFLARPLEIDQVEQLLGQLPAATSTLGRDSVRAANPTEEAAG